MPALAVSRANLSAISDSSSPLPLLVSPRPLPFPPERSGADKISIGGDAVDAAEAYYASGCQKNGKTAIEQISEVYGKQAVVVSCRAV